MRPESASQPDTRAATATLVESVGPSLAVFVTLQALDVVTTMLGLRLGARETSYFISRILHFGPLPALLMSKAIALILVSAVVALGRVRLMRRVNLWYAALVTWNFIMILLEVLRRSRL